MAPTLLLIRKLLIKIYSQNIRNIFVNLWFIKEKSFFLIKYAINKIAMIETDKSLKNGPEIRVIGNNIINIEGIFSKKK